jgi:hypothetical protein
MDLTFLYIKVPFYLGELTEKVSQENRIPILKASQDHLKVTLNSFATAVSKFNFECTFSLFGFGCAGICFHMRGA